MLIFKIIFTVIASIIASFLLIHLLAFLGIFLVVAYPIWWLLVPQKTPNFICFIKYNVDPFFEDEGEIKKEKLVCSHSFSSVLANTALILLVVLFCAGFVFGESKILFKLGFPPTPKTVSFVIPSKGQYRLGEIFPLKIDIIGVKTPINAVQADVGFDPHRLAVIDVSTAGSFANIFIQKEISNEVGYARLTGGLPNPGFFADHGVFGTIFFQGKAPGITRVEFLPSSMVLVNDGRGTNVLKDLASVSYLILPEEISEEEEEMQKTIIIKPGVLGEKSEDTQMKFYEEKKVLGADVERETQKGKEFNLLKIFLDALELVNRLILVFWGKMFSLFK